MSAIDAVGRTPMVRLEHLVDDGSGLKYLAGGVYDRVTASDSEPAGADLA